MQNTIYIGEYFLINKSSSPPAHIRSSCPARNSARRHHRLQVSGDRDNPDRDKMSGVTPYSDYFIKRVIGPGETIELRGATVLITINRSPNIAFRQSRD